MFMIILKSTDLLFRIKKYIQMLKCDVYLCTVFNTNNIVNNINVIINTF